jgi:hypothetical protein
LAWALSALCQYFRIPFDEALAASQFSPPYDFESVARAAQMLGLEDAPGRQAEETRGAFQRRTRAGFERATAG